MPDARLGCMPISHRVLGWCGFCPGKTIGDEVIAWRIEAARAIDTTEEMQMEPDKPTRAECPVCHTSVKINVDGRLRRHPLPHDSSEICWGRWSEERSQK